MFNPDPNPDTNQTPGTQQPDRSGGVETPTPEKRPPEVPPVEVPAYNPTPQQIPEKAKQ